jgi:glutamate-ammonia-ligase adenylyltransferase
VAHHPRVLALRDEARQRLVRLVQRTAQWLKEGHVSEEAAVRIADWIEPLLRRESYLALLLERPSVHERLLRLLGAARWPARYLLQHPGVIDELASDAMLAERFQAEEFEREIEHRRRSLQTTGEDDDETLLNLLRRAHHAEVFPHPGARCGRPPERGAGGRRPERAGRRDAARHRPLVLAAPAQPPPRHSRSLPSLATASSAARSWVTAAIWTSCLCTKTTTSAAGEVYAAFVRKLINWLTVKTAEGDLFEIDTALRPNGNSGMLVTSFDAYARYQQQRGSNTAWTWEHQAMTRARFVLGDDSLRTRFDAVREAVITSQRDSWCCHRRLRKRSWFPIWATLPCCSALKPAACCPRVWAMRRHGPTGSCGASSTRPGSMRSPPRWSLKWWPLNARPSNAFGQPPSIDRMRS